MYLFYTFQNSGCKLDFESPIFKVEPHDKDTYIKADIWYYDARVA